MALKVSQDLQFQRREWAVQRVAWAAMYVAIAAALTGVFGAGPLSQSSVRSDEGLVEVEYRKYARLGGEYAFAVSVRRELAEGDELQLFVRRAFLEAMQVQHVTPQPSSVTASGRELRYAIPVTPDANEILVTFALTPEGVGTAFATVRAGDAPPLPFRVFVYP